MAAAVRSAVVPGLAEWRSSRSERSKRATDRRPASLRTPPSASTLPASRDTLAARSRPARRAMWVSDVVYVPLDTPLLEAARRVGCATVDGGHMNVGQAVGGFKLFTGLDADAARMDAHFRRLVS